MSRAASTIGPRPQRGVALIFVLVMMSLVFSIAAISARLSSSGERVGASERDRQVALQGAEAALIDAEREITEPLESQRACSLHFAAFAPGCSAETDLRGLCNADITNSDTPLYKLIDFNENDDDLRKYVRYGEFTSLTYEFAGNETSSIGLADVGKPASPPKYIIERKKLAVPLDGVDQNGLLRKVQMDYGTYVVTAVGYGLSKRTMVMLQAVIVHPKPANRCAGSSL